MLKASDFSTVNAQLTIFVPDFSGFSASNVLATVLGKYASLYDGEVQALPLPEGAPPEIPRVVLQSKDGILRLDAAPLRITFSWFAGALPVAAPGKGIPTCLEVLEHYVKSLNVQVSRLALVLNRVYKTQNSAHLISEQFCKPELQETLFKNSENFELHNHCQSELQDVPVNVWVRCKSGQLLTDSQAEPVLLIEQDINTLAENVQIFTIEQISSYFHSALEQAETLLQSYFPGK